MKKYAILVLINSIIIVFHSRPKRVSIRILSIYVYICHLCDLFSQWNFVLQIARHCIGGKVKDWNFNSATGRFVVYQITNGANVNPTNC